MRCARSMSLSPVYVSAAHAAQRTLLFESLEMQHVVEACRVLLAQQLIALHGELGDLSLNLELALVLSFDGVVQRLATGLEASLLCAQDGHALAIRAGRGLGDGQRIGLGRLDGLDERRLLHRSALLTRANAQPPPARREPSPLLLPPPSARPWPRRADARQRRPPRLLARRSRLRPQRC